MADELRHITVGTELTQAEYEAITGHSFNSQATGDIPYASSATQISRLAIGAAAQVLTTSGGIPAWVAPTARSTQAAIEAETDEATYVSPNRVRNSPGVAKCWGSIAAAGTLESPSYNTASITDTGAGDRTAVIATDFSSAVYSVQTTVDAAPTAGDPSSRYDTRAVGSVRLTTFSASNQVLTDYPHSYVMFGDQ